MKRVLVLIIATFVNYAAAQVPGFGWCPDYPPMEDFDLNRYTGVWYEAERYFTVLEAGSRCVRSNYTKGSDGKFRVSNEITNRLTGIRRVLDGVVQNIGKGGEGKISVKYNTLPVPVDTQYSVLDTDYDTYSVVWSCSSLGPLNTQNAWIMTRERLAPGTILQQAYGVLDKYKISRTFFVKTDQSDCLFTDPTQEYKGDPPIPLQSYYFGQPKDQAHPEQPTIQVKTEKIDLPAPQVPIIHQIQENSPKLEPIPPEPIKEQQAQQQQQQQQSIEKLESTNQPAQPSSSS